MKWLIIFVFTLLSLTLFFQPNKTFVKCFDYFYYSLLACGLFLGVTVSSDRFEAYYNNSQWQTLYDLIEDISLGCESLLLFDENFQSNSFNNVANICWDLEEFTELDPRFELLSKRKIGESLIKLSDVFQTFIGAYERLSLTAPNLAAHEDIIVLFDPIYQTRDEWWNALSLSNPQTHSYSDLKTFLLFLTLWPKLIALALALKFSKTTAEITYLDRT